MSGFAKCTLCNETIHYNQPGTSLLIRHLTENHPEQQFVIAHAVKQRIHHGSPLGDNYQNVDYQNENIHNAPETIDDFPRESRQPRVPLEKRVPRPSNDQKADENLPRKQDFIGSQLRGRKIYYKTTVAQWRPAHSRVTCPECGVRQFPTVRSSANKYTRSHWGSMCIMTCWPFCFLPYVFTSPTKHHLHCSNCNAFLGLYDPSREVVDVHPSKRGGIVSRRSAGVVNGRKLKPYGVG
ncbi:uncharacterized protein LOC129780147 [Toxorhynchites rutilus septentrionalis]|uniref:uncharacterized protein LOC129780147 n=1 Tax=Toxorhynchites rutilus septentrionalis TaxID=329112 RepID=UPI00247A4C0F|nr:uncharacterized protein LOC129780147 [Toxorhynchites rutilus septentrionalis]